MTTLYKRDNADGVRICKFELEGNQYRAVTGLLNGQLVAAKWTVCEGKNIGRSNETTPENQAVLEVAAKIKKHIDQGYRLSIDEIDSVEFKEPMKAHEFGKVTAKKALSFPVYSNPKLDGMRCVINHEGMKTRNGKPILSAPHIWLELRDYLEEHQNITLDGELYCDKLKNDFNKIISLAKKTKPTPEDLEESRKTLQFWIFDVIDSDQPDMKFSERKKWLISFFKGDV